MIVFKKSDVGTTVMIIAKSQGVIFYLVPVFKSVCQGIGQAKKYVSELSVFITNDYLFS